MMSNDEHQRLMCLALDEKVELSKSIIKQALERFSRDEFCLAWTGGKDSTTMLWLYREVLKESGQSLPRAIFIDEGHVFEEIIDLVNRIKEQWSVSVTILKNTDVSDKVEKVGDIIRVKDLSVRNQAEIEKLGCTEATFNFEPESYLCNHLMKTVAMKMFLEKNGVVALSTAIRWDEQEARVAEEYFSPREDPGHTRVHPILHFTERDIWNTIHANSIPFCSLYYKGYRSLGAKGSTVKVSDKPAWEQDLENTVERAGRGQDKEEIMEQLRSLGYM